MGGFVKANGAFKLFLTDVAPRANRIRDDADIECGHFAKVGRQN